MLKHKADLRTIAYMFTFVSYPGMSSYYQITEGIIPFMKKMKKERPERFWEYIMQCVVLVV